MLVTMLPDTFTDLTTEYEALTHAAGIIDHAVGGVLRLRGKDRVRFLNAMVTNDVARLTPGHAAAALITTTKGKVIAELLVLARADELLVLVLQGPVARVVTTLDAHIIADDVELENVTEQFGVIAVEGPKCRELVWRIFPREPLPMEAFAFTENQYQGLHATVIRHSVVGDKGMLMLIPAEHHERLKSYLVQGAVGLDATEIGRAAWNTRRIEKGRPWFGIDVTEENFPAECGLEAHVSYEKGCYLGQETIARMHYRGHPNWKLVGLAGDGNVPAIGALLETTGEGAAPQAGRITSAVYSPALKRALCLGFVRAAMAAPGAVFFVSEGGNPESLTIVELPLKGDTRHA